MLEKEEKIIQESLLSIRAYLSRPKSLKEEIEKLSKKSSNLQEFMENLKNQTPSIASDLRTDRRIFLNELHKHLS